VKDFLQYLVIYNMLSGGTDIVALLKNIMRKQIIFSILFCAAISMNTPVFAQDKNDSGYSAQGSTNPQTPVSGAATNTLSGSPANDTMTNAARSDNSGAGNTAAAAEPGAAHSPGGSSDYTNRPNDQHNSGNWGLLGLLGLFGLLGYLRPAGRTHDH
jgi:hypothetical protein